jgi:uncharacterized protein
MQVPGTSLLDVNVWLGLAVSAHAHHEAAKNWFDGEVPRQCAFCRLTQLALLRHLTNGKIMGMGNVQTQEQAWSVYEALAADPRVIYLEEPSGLTAAFKSHTQAAEPAQKRWTDAFLAAFAECHHIQLVTFGSDFKRFSGLSVHLLIG